MRTGAIVYVVGEKNIGDDFDVESAVRNLNIKADRVEVVAPKIGHFDVMDAWWFLLTKGMNRIICITAEVVNNTLKPIGHELRLYG